MRKELNMKKLILCLALLPTIAQSDAICVDRTTGATIIIKGVCPYPFTFVGFDGR